MDVTYFLLKEVLNSNDVNNIFVECLYGRAVNHEKRVNGSIEVMDNMEDETSFNINKDTA